MFLFSIIISAIFYKKNYEQFILVILRYINLVSEKD